MTIDETNMLNKKAETRSDGVYVFRQYLWAVKNKKFIAFIDRYGQVHRRFGSFNTQIGTFAEVPQWEWKKKLIEWLRLQ